MMGAEESKGGSPCYGLMGPSTVVSNMNRQAQMARAWALLHQCSLDQWKCGHGGLYLICLNNISNFLTICFPYTVKPV